MILAFIPKTPLKCFTLKIEDLTLYGKIYIDNLNIKTKLFDNYFIIKVPI